MKLSVLNASGAHISASAQPNQIHVNIEGVMPVDLLRQIDISIAIDYYGVAELLDMIGEDELRAYLHPAK